MPCKDCHQEERCDAAGVCQVFDLAPFPHGGHRLPVRSMPAAERDCLRQLACNWPQCNCDPVKDQQKGDA